VYRQHIRINWVGSRHVHREERLRTALLSMTERMAQRKTGNGYGCSREPWSSSHVVTGDQTERNDPLTDCRTPVYQIVRRN